MKLFKLIIEDLISADKINEHHKFKVYSVVEFGDISKLQEVFSKYELAPGNEFNIKIDSNDKWFRIVGQTIQGMTDEELQSFIDDNEDELIGIHDALVNENEASNVIEVRTELLNKYLVEQDNIDDLEERELIYQDVNVESIAEVLTEVNLAALKAQLGYYGTWQLINVDGMNYLISD